MRLDHPKLPKGYSLCPPKGWSSCFHYKRKGKTMILDHSKLPKGYSLWPPKEWSSYLLYKSKRKQRYWTIQSFPKGIPFYLPKGEVAISIIKKTIILGFPEFPKGYSLWPPKEWSSNCPPKKQGKTIILDLPKGIPCDLLKSEIAIPFITRNEKQWYWTSQSLPKGTPLTSQRVKYSLPS